MTWKREEKEAYNFPGKCGMWSKQALDGREEHGKVPFHISIFTIFITSAEVERKFPSAFWSFKSAFSSSFDFDFNPNSKRVCWRMHNVRYHSLPHCAVAYWQNLSKHYHHNTWSKGFPFSSLPRNSVFFPFRGMFCS